jgi:hypothetical protein
MAAESFCTSKAALIIHLASSMGATAQIEVKVKCKHKEEDN